MTENVHPELDALLNASAPPTTTHGPERLAALEAMARDARPTRRLARRPLAIGAGALALVLAGGAAAAAAFDWPVPWAMDAAADYAYAVPGGGHCSGIMGNVEGPPDAVAAANAFLGRPDLLQIIDVDGAIGVIRGTEVDPGSGTEGRSADGEYQLAFQMAVQDALRHALAAEGYDLNVLSMEVVVSCSGPDAPNPVDAARG